MNHLAKHFIKTTALGTFFVASKQEATGAVMIDARWNVQPVVGESLKDFYTRGRNAGATC